MQNELWDAIKRDQLPWMGEVATEALAVYHVFGDTRLARRSLAVLAELGPAPARPLERQLYPGLQAVWKGQDGELSGVPAYTLWWVVGLADYVRYTGDRGLLTEYTPELLAALRHIARHVGSDGLWHLRRSRSADAWTPLSAMSCEACCHLLACLALSRGIELVASLGRLDAADYCSALWKHMVDAARRAWFGSDLQEMRSTDPAKRPVLDLPNDGQHAGATHHLYAMAVRSGCLSPQEAAELFDRSRADHIQDPLTYWYRTFDLEAASLVGQVEWGLSYLRQHWGAALKAGTATFWETFDPSWLGQDPHGMSIVTGENATYGGYRTSHCAGAAAGAVSWLHRAVLGVTPVRDGFRTIRFSPSLGDLDWAQGTIPTPRGPIHVSLRRRRGALPRAEIALPPDVELLLGENIPHMWQIEDRRHAESERETGC
jgi:hypothetical protein